MPSYYGLDAEDRAQIDTAAAEYRAGEIKRLITQILEDIDTLNDLVTKDFKELSFEWSDEFQRKWKSVYDNGVPAVVADMTKTVENVGRTVETMERFSQQG